MGDAAADAAPVPMGPMHPFPAKQLDSVPPLQQVEQLLGDDGMLMRFARSSAESAPTERAAAGAEEQAVDRGAVARSLSLLEEEVLVRTQNAASACSVVLFVPRRRGEPRARHFFRRLTERGLRTALPAPQHTRRRVSERRDTVVLVGDHGVGKTTLVNLLLMLTETDAATYSSGPLRAAAPRVAYTGTDGRRVEHDLEALEVRCARRTAERQLCLSGRFCGPTNSSPGHQGDPRGRGRRSRAHRRRAGAPRARRALPSARQCGGGGAAGARRTRAV